MPRRGNDQDDGDSRERPDALPRADGKKLLLLGGAGAPAMSSLNRTPLQLYSVALTRSTVTAFRGFVEGRVSYTNVNLKFAPCVGACVSP